MKGMDKFDISFEKNSKGICNEVFTVGDRVIVSIEKSHSQRSKSCKNSATLNDIEDTVQSRFSSMSLLLPDLEVSVSSGIVSNVAQNSISVDVAQKPRRLIEFIREKHDSKTHLSCRLDKDELFSTMHTLR